MIEFAKYGIVTVLSFLYIAYLIEIYRHMTKPLKPLSRQTPHKKLWRIILFFIGIVCTILFAYIIRQFLLPRPVFDLIVVSLQTIFTIPFFGALLTDHLLHAWQKKRLPYSITLLILLCTALVAIGSNLLIVFASQPTIQKAADILEVATDITTVCFILVLGFLGFQYFKNTGK